MRGILSIEKLTNALDKSAKKYLASQNILRFFSNDTGQWRAYNVLLYLNELSLSNPNESDYTQHLLALTLAIWESGSFVLASQIAEKLIIGTYTCSTTPGGFSEHNTLTSEVFSSDLLNASIKKALRDKGSDDSAIVMGYCKFQGMREIFALLRAKMSHSERTSFSQNVNGYVKALTIQHKILDRNIHLSHEMR